MWWGIFFKKNPPVPKGWELEQRASWWALPIAHGRHSKPEVPWTVEFAAPFRMNDRNKTCMIGSGLKLFRMDSKEILEAAGTIFKRGWLTVSHVLEVLGIQILSVQRAKSHLNWAWPSPAGQSRQWGQGGSMSSIWLVVCSHLWLKSVGEERWRKYSWQEMVERMQMLRNWAMSLTRDLHRGSVAQHFWAAFLIGSNWHKVPMKRSEGCYGLLQLPKRWPSESGQWQRTIGFVDRLVVDVSLRKRNSAWKTCFPMVQLLNSQGPTFFFFGWVATTTFAVNWCGINFELWKVTLEVKFLDSQEVPESFLWNLQKTEHELHLHQTDQFRYWPTSNNLSMLPVL